MKALIFLPLLLIFIPLGLGIVLFLSLVGKNAAKDEWEGEVVDKTHNTKDEDHNRVSHFYTLVIKTSKGEERKIAVMADAYTRAKVGDKYKKVKGKLNPEKIVVLFFVLMSGAILGGCQPKIEENPQVTGDNVQKVAKVGKCKPEDVTIEGYGDKGKRLPNCFVEYPGEPSREDKSYYVVDDVCGQFTKEFIQNALGKPIVKTEPPQFDGLFNCRYFLDDKNDHVLLVFEYLKIANQKKGNEEMGRRTEESDKIPMRNMLVWQENGLLNSIFLVLGDDKFISINRSSESKLTTDELIGFAANIAKEIKDYK